MVIDEKVSNDKAELLKVARNIIGHEE